MCVCVCVRENIVFRSIIWNAIKYLWQCLNKPNEAHIRLINEIFNIKLLFFFFFWLFLCTLMLTEGKSIAFNIGFHICNHEYGIIAINSRISLSVVFRDIFHQKLFNFPLCSFNFFKFTQSHPTLSIISICLNVRKRVDLCVFLPHLRKLWAFIIKRTNFQFPEIYSWWSTWHSLNISCSNIWLRLSFPMRCAAIINRRGRSSSSKRALFIWDVYQARFAFFLTSPLTLFLIIS